jgi:hypothetical protein
MRFTILFVILGALLAAMLAGQASAGNKKENIGIFSLY